jgi:hypothetical protein
VNLLYVAGLLALMLWGAGAFSIDRLLAHRKRAPEDQRAVRQESAGG